VDFNRVQIAVSSQGVI